LGLFCLLLAGSFSASNAEDVRWASKVTPPERYAAVGVPNFLAAVGLPITVEDFGPTYLYPNGLASLDPSLAGVVFQPGQLLALEGNGGHGAGVSRGWESSRWTFEDASGHRVEYRYNETQDVPVNNKLNGVNAVVSSGPVDGSQYAHFFGMCCKTPGNDVQGYIIFDLASMNIDPNTVKVSVEGWHEADGSSGEGSPDPEAFGIVE
jgi:hypothetical protein